MSWGNTYPSRLTKVQTKQNKCIRCLFFSHKRESSAPYFKLLGILKLEIYCDDHSSLSGILNIDKLFELKISLLAHKM